MLRSTLVNLLPRAGSAAPIRKSHKVLVTDRKGYVSGGYPAAPDVSISKKNGNTVLDIMANKKSIGGVYMLNEKGATITKLKTALQSQVKSKLSHPVEQNQNVNQF